MAGIEPTAVAAAARGHALITPKRTIPAALNPLIAYALNVEYPQSGPDTFRYATTTGPVLGTAGPIRHFRVAIESNIKVHGMDDFTAKINATLGDPRSWVARPPYRLQQVPAELAAQFTIYLTTPADHEPVVRTAAVARLHVLPPGPKVVLNLARWMTSVPYYTRDEVVLDTYRTYMINHEVGHALGHGHELCPGPGKLAPVMEQQTFGLHGCEPNPWRLRKRQALRRAARTVLIRHSRGRLRHDGALSTPRCPTRTAAQTRSRRWLGSRWPERGTPRRLR